MEIANDEGYSNDDIINEFFVQLNDAKEYINLSRPTAVDLSWALNKTYDAAVIANEDFEGDYIGDRLDHIVYAIKMEAMAIYSNNIDMCKSIGEHALHLLRPEILFLHTVTQVSLLQLITVQQQLLCI